MSKLLFILFFTLVSLGFKQAQGQSSDHRLIVTLKGAPIDSLFAYDYTENMYLFTGEKIAENTWSIRVPDSIALFSERMLLLTSYFNPSDTSKTSIRFTSPLPNQLKVHNVGFQDRINYIEGVYKETDILKNIKIENNLDEPGSFVIGKQIIMDFEIIEDKFPSSDIMVRAHEPYFAWFMSHSNGKTMSYEEHLSHYFNLAQKFPDSRYLIDNLSDNLLNFKNTEDVKLIYEALSDKLKQSHWADKIKNYLNPKFQNSYLQNLTTNQSESLIQDESRYNLIIFSASWCVPCIEEIPLLKEIYADLNTDLDFTYVSIDTEKYIPAFEKVLEEHQIPWRTMYANENIKEIQHRYTVQQIPHTILVSPNKAFEFLDVRREKDKERLYELVNRGVKE